MLASFLAILMVAGDPAVEMAVAIERGDAAAVTALLEDGQPADLPLGGDGDGRHTPLQLAAWNGRTEIAKLLLAHGADVNATSEVHASALDAAVQRGWDDMVAVLIEAGADVNRADSRQNTPLTNAVFGGRREIVELLVKAKADLTVSVYGNTPLMFAAQAGDSEMIRLLVRSGAKVDGVAKGEYGGRNALLAAAAAGELEAVKTLLELKANVNFRGPEGETPLKAAREAGHAEVVAALQAAGAREGTVPAKGKK